MLYVLPEVSLLVQPFLVTGRLVKEKESFGTV